MYATAAQHETDRVRAHTDPEVLADLDAEPVDRVHGLAADGPRAVSDRLAGQDRESDIHDEERTT